VAPAVSGLGASGIDRGLAQPGIAGRPVWKTRPHQGCSLKNPCVTGMAVPHKRAANVRFVPTADMPRKRILIERRGLSWPWPKMS